MVELLDFAPLFESLSRIVTVVLVAMAVGIVVMVRSEVRRAQRRRY